MEILRINKIVFFLCLVSIKLYPQETNGFYLTKDTIKIPDPIIISVKGKAGKIITSSQEYNRSSNIEKLLNDNKAFTSMIFGKKIILKFQNVTVVIKKIL